MNEIINAAASLAMDAHAGQVRRGSNLPYFSHPAAVADIVAAYLGYDDVAPIAMAYLHDVVEDCDVPIGDIVAAFGPRIAAGVAALSKIDGVDYRAGLAAAESVVASVKCADIIHNASDVAAMDPAFAARWIPKKIDDMAYLAHANPAIYARAAEVLAVALAAALAAIG